MSHIDKIAVIVPVHNRKNVTLSCMQQLQDIDAHGYQPDIVLVDDGSTDGTPEAVAREFPKTIILEGDGNLWWAGGVNKGLEYALSHDYDYVYIINDDIEMKQDALQVLYDTIKKHGHSVCSSIFIDRVHRNFVLYAGYNYSGAFKKLKSPLKGYVTGTYRGRILSVDCLSSKSVLIPIDIVREVGLFNSNLFPHGISDYEYLMRIKSHGYSLLVNTDSLVYTGESTSNIHYLIYNKNISETLQVLGSVKYKKSLKAAYNFYVSRGSPGWGHLRLVYHLFPYFVWICLKVLLPRPLLHKILIKTGRVRLDESGGSQHISTRTRAVHKKAKALKTKMRKALAFVFRFSGIPFLIREVFCKNKSTILVYHDPDPEIFRRHMEFVSKYYSIIPLSQMVEAIERKDWASMPPKALVIVFDDGLKGNYRLLDVIKQFKIRPTIYLCSHIVNTQRKFWFGAGFQNHHSLKKYENEYRLHELRKKVNYEPHKEYDERQALNLEEIEAMSPYVDFQSHSKYHPILTNCTDEDCREEIEGSKMHLQKILNKSIEHFCYPNGDYTEREVNYIRKAGYKSSRTVDAGWNDVNSSPYKLKAMYVDDFASKSILIAQISGFFAYLRYVRFGSFRGKHPPYT